LTSRPTRLAYAVEAALAADAALHLLWATGSTWPASEVRLLSYALLGAEVSFAPGLLLALAGTALAALALIHARARVTRDHRLYPLLQAGTLAFLAFLCFRGMAGLVWCLGIGTPPDYPAYYWLNLLLYTPLCLAMAAAVFAVSRHGAKPLRLRGKLALAAPLVAIAALLAGAYAWAPTEAPYDPAEAGVDSRYADTDLARFHYTREGEGSPVVLLSPGASWLFAWQEQAHTLAAEHTVYAVDLPGQGFTELHQDFDYTLEAVTEAIDAFLDSQDLDTVALAGYSWSGGWALAYAQAHPDRVDRLVLLAPSGADRPDPATWEALKPPVAGELLTNVYSGRDAAEESLLGIVEHDEVVTDALIDAFWKPNTRTVNLRSTYLYERGLDWYSTEAAMPAIRQPVLLVWGTGDTVVPIADAEVFTTRLPDARLEILDGCGHALTIDCPDQVDTLMSGFLA
jgi:4,5:9,10-diseco-3-hydroxy-5,9,17-trioxoandrosta-1(10),2-diene-4-oate hydrolase